MSALHRSVQKNTAKIDMPVVADLLSQCCQFEELTVEEIVISINIHEYS